MSRHIIDAPARVKHKASKLADAITLANNYLATNRIQRLKMAREVEHSYTPLPEAFVPGNSIKFRNFQVVPRKPKAHVGAAPVSNTANVQELDGESDRDSDGEASGRADSCAPPSDATKGVHELGLREPIRL